MAPMSQNIFAGRAVPSWSAPWGTTGMDSVVTVMMMSGFPSTSRGPDENRDVQAMSFIIAISPAGTMHKM